MTDNKPQRSRKAKQNKPEVTEKAAAVAENTVTATQQVTDFIAGLPVFTMKKQNNQWYAAIGREAGLNLTSKVGIVRLFNSGHPSVQFVTVEFAYSDIKAGEMYFTIESNLLKK